MRKVDAVRIRELLGNVNESLQHLCKLKKINQNEFLADFRNTESAKYLDELCRQIAQWLLTQPK